MPYYPEKKPEFPEEPKQEMKTTEKRRKLLRLSLAVVFCLLIGYGGIRLILYYSDLSASRETGRELRQIRDQADSETASFVPAEAETGSPSPASAGQEPQNKETMLTDDGALPPGQDQQREETELTSGGYRIRTIRSWKYRNSSAACERKAGTSSAGSVLMRWMKRSRRRTTRFS